MGWFVVMACPLMRVSYGKVSIISTAMYLMEMDIIFFFILFVELIPCIIKRFRGKVILRC